MRAVFSTKMTVADTVQEPGTVHLVYSDGYKSKVPDSVFLRDFQTQSQMSFGHAIFVLKQGGAVARAGWNGKNMWLRLQSPDANSKMSLPYIYMRTADDKLVPWLASQTDMLADDWQALYLGNVSDIHRNLLGVDKAGTA